VHGPGFLLGNEASQRGLAYLACSQQCHHGKLTQEAKQRIFMWGAWDHVFTISLKNVFVKYDIQ
jgi:hypothetical protein